MAILPNGYIVAEGQSSDASIREYDPRSENLTRQFDNTTRNRMLSINMLLQPPMLF